MSKKKIVWLNKDENSNIRIKWGQKPRKRTRKEHAEFIKSGFLSRDLWEMLNNKY